MSKFIYVKTDEGYDLVLNTETINGIERNPNNMEGSVWLWTTWNNRGASVIHNRGQIVVNESFESIMSRLECK